MGLESFRAELTDTKLPASEVVKSLLEIEGAAWDEQGTILPHQKCFLVRRQNSVVELEISEYPVVLSCRITVCHPPSADDVFIQLLSEMAARFSMKTVTCIDGLTPDSASIINNLGELDNTVRQAIARKRAVWKRQFGEVESAYTEAEVYQHIIIPQCNPQVKTTTA